MSERKSKEKFNEQIQEITNNTKDNDPAYTVTEPEDLQPEYSMLNNVERKLQPSNEASSAQQSSRTIQTNNDEQIFGDFCASEMRQMKNPTNKQAFKKLIMEAIINVENAEALGLTCSFGSISIERTLTLANDSCSGVGTTSSPKSPNQVNGSDLPDPDPSTRPSNRSPVKKSYSEENTFPGKPCRWSPHPSDNCPLLKQKCPDQFNRPRNTSSQTPRRSQNDSYPPQNRGSKHFTGSRNTFSRTNHTNPRDCSSDQRDFEQNVCAGNTCPVSNPCDSSSFQQMVVEAPHYTTNWLKKNTLRQRFPVMDPCLDSNCCGTPRFCPRSRPFPRHFQSLNEFEEFITERERDHCNSRTPNRMNSQEYANGNLPRVESCSDSFDPSTAFFTKL